MQSANAYEYQTYKIPRTVQQVIPMDVLYSDGMMQRAGQKREHTYSKSWRVQDINFAVATDDIREDIIHKFTDFLRTLEDGRTATTKITIHNHRIDKLRFEDDALISMQQDNLDTYRKEFNGVLINKQSQTGNIVQDKYITVTSPHRDPDGARTFFRRIENEIKRQFQKMESAVTEIVAHERLRIFHDFFRPGEELFFNFDLEASARRGHDWKDYICPDGLENKNDHIIMGNKYVRTLFLHEYGSSINEDLVKELTELNRDLVLSIDFLPVQQDEARQMVQNTLLGQTTNAARFNKKQVDSNTFMNIPFETQQQIQQSEILLEDLTERGQRLFYVLITIAHIADSKEELDSDTESLISIGRRHECRFGVPYFNQIDTLKTVLPFGTRLIKGDRSMTTETAAGLIPFHMATLNDANGFYYGENAISKHLLLLNRKRLANGNGFIIGYSGSGKSFMAKEEMVQAILNTNDDVIVIDPDREYQHLIKALGGEVIRLSPGSNNHINAMDLNAGYGEESSILEKTDFVVTLCEKMAKGYRPKEEPIVDRCAMLLYEDYEARNYAGDAPTLRDLSALLHKQPEKEAKDIAVKLERYIEGSLNIFAYQTNVDLNNRVLCFDTKALGDGGLKTVAMLVVLDAVVNRMSRNQEQKKNTWLYIDEIYLLFKTEFSITFLEWLWRRVRKLGGLCTGITQNVSELLEVSAACNMLSNSEFLIMMNQSPNDRDALISMFYLSTQQSEYITNSVIGSGLIKCGKSFIPMENKFDEQTQLYKLMTTKLDERL